MKKNKGFVYINSSARSYGKGIFKIGKSVDADQRRREHSTALPYPQKTEKQWLVEDMDSAEKLLLKRLDAHRIKGQGAGTEFVKGSLKKFIKIGDDLFVNKGSEISDDDHWTRFRAGCLWLLRQRVRTGIIGYKVNGKSAIPRLYAKLDSIGYRNVHNFYSWKHLKKEIADVKIYDAECEHRNILATKDPSTLQPRPMDSLIVDYHKRYTQSLLSWMVRKYVHICWEEVSRIIGLRNFARKRVMDQNCVKKCLGGRKEGSVSDDCQCKEAKMAANLDHGFLQLHQILDTMDKFDDESLSAEDSRLRKEMPGRFLKTEKYIHSHTRPAWHERMFGGKPEPIYRDRNVYDTHEQKVYDLLVWTQKMTKSWMEHKECPGDGKQGPCWYHFVYKRGKKRHKSFVTLSMENMNRFLTQLKPFALSTLNDESTFTLLYDAQEPKI
jgi:hypothetical protein